VTNFVVVAAACCEALVDGGAIELFDLGTVAVRGTVVVAKVVAVPAATKIQLIWNGKSQLSYRWRCVAKRC